MVDLYLHTRTLPWLDEEYFLPEIYYKCIFKKRQNFVGITFVDCMSNGVGKEVSSLIKFPDLAEEFRHTFSVMYFIIFLDINPEIPR